LNIALPALVVFLVLLPGFIARVQIERVEQQSLDYAPFGTVVAEGLLTAAVLHAVWLVGVWAFCDKVISPELLFGLLSSNQSLQATAISGISQQAADIALYFSSLLACAYVVAKGVRMAITRCRLDREGAVMANLFRFNRAPWYYLLSGADFKSDEVPDLVVASAVLQVAGESVLYVGYLEDYEFDRQGMLERLILSNVQRRPLASDKSADDDGRNRYYPIDGDYFVIKYADVVTLNIRYLKFEEAAPSGTSRPSPALMAATGCG